MLSERSMEILIKPILTEKTANLSDNKKNKVVAFQVARDANKQEIKRAVEKNFDVKVEKVRTMNYRGKSCRYRQHDGQHSDWKKAYVSLQEGYDINFGGLE